MTNDDFLVEVSDLSPVRHNDTDHDKYRNFQQSIENIHYARAERNTRQYRKKNLQHWVQQLPMRWKNATLRGLDRHPEVSREILKRMKNGVSSFYITGESSSGKTYVSYAIIRKIISDGKVQPSEVKIVSESEILSLSRRGFEGQKKFDDILHGGYKLFFIDHMGTKEKYDDKELAMLSAFIDYIYSNSVIFIGTSNVSYKKFSHSFGASTFGRFEDLARPGSINLSSSGEILEEDDDDDDFLEDYEKW